MNEPSQSPSSTGSSTRATPSWIDGFVEYTKGTQSPELFRRWAAVSIISGAMERKAYVSAFKRTLYPNLYVLLVAGPGVGKTDAIRGVFDFWDTITVLHQAPSNISRASLIDALAKAERTILRPTASEPFTKFNSLNVAADEFGVFLQQYEGSFMSTLNKLYDGTIYTEEKRGMKDGIRIEKPLLSLVAGTTPMWLGATLPETAWAEGFSSRLLLVYSGERIKVNPWAQAEDNTLAFEKLKKDLAKINNLFGKFSFAPDMAAAYEAWYMLDCPPIPEHPKLEHYLPRRHVHLLKLCMVMSASRSDDMVVRMEDYQEALDLLLSTEQTMPDVFKSMRYNSDGNVIDEAYNFIAVTYAKEQAAVSEARIVHFLSQRMPSHNVLKVLDLMQQSNYIQVAAIGDRGRNTYKPVPKSARD